MTRDELRTASPEVIAAMVWMTAKTASEAITILFNAGYRGAALVPPQGWKSKVKH